MSGKKLQWANIARYVNLAFSFGITMIAAVFLGFYAGWWVDHRFNTFPGFMVLGVLLGVGVGFYSLWKELAGLMDNKPEKNAKRENEEQRDDEQGK